ncbi:uncharacterized protein LOC106878651 [Octopus bimaculoides]|uniref:uncharacterized protein LOC106878651 n=1 Tax=Octopus bimaculoides TaxID=37653 RepID=UPI0022DF19C9|nr:uncharacterized protein LOC106878651 [Octopus bimaculoides]
MLASQGEKLSQDRTVNDSDSILSSQPLEDPEEDERESVTMSQIFKDEDFPLESDAERHNYIKSDDFSQSLDEEMVSDDILDVESDEETIPQFDGPIDEKPADEQPKIRKRMGPRGPVISSANNPSPVSSEGQASSFSNYGPIFQNDPGFLGSGSNMQAYQSPTNYQDYDRRWDTHAFREDMSSGVPSVDQQSSHWNPAWSRSLHSARADPSSYAGAGNVHGNNGSYMTEGFSRPYANQQPQNHPSQAATLSESSTDQYPASFPYDMTNIYSPDSYSRSRTSDSGHTSDPHNSPFAGHLSPSPGYSRDGFESSRSPVPLSGNVGIQGSGSSMYNQTPSLPPPEESQGSFHKLLTCNDSPKQSIPADLSTHQSLQRSISRCSTHSSESISMGASTTPDPFKSLPKPVSSEDTTMETFEKMSSIEKLDETTEGRSSVDSSNHPPSETGNASLTPLDGSNSQKKHMSSINISHEDLFGTPSLNSCADLSSDSFTSAEGSRHQSVVDQSNQGSFISSGYSNKNTSHPQRCSSVTSEEEAPSYQSLTMSFPGNQSGNRSHSAIASLEQMVSSVGGYDIGYDYAAFPNRAWQCAGTQPSHNVTPLHNISAGPTMPPGGNLPANTSMPSGTSMSTGSNMPSAPSISSGPNMPPNQTLTSGQNMTRSNMPPVSNMTLGSGMPSGSNLHSAPNMTPGHNIQNRNLSSSGHNMPAISPGPSLTPTNMPPHSIPTNHNMPSRPNVAPVNMSQSQHVTQVRALTPNMSTSLHGGHTMGRSVTPHGHGHAMHPQVHNISQGHSVHPSHNLAAAPQLPPPGHSPATSPPSAHGHNMSGHSISSGHNMMQTHNLPQGHHVTQGHERSHSYNISEPNYTTQDVMMPKQGRMALKKKRGEADNWSYGKSYYQQGRSWNQHPGPPGQNYRNTTYWRYMDTYQTYQGYVQNPKVEPGTISQTPKLQPVLPPGAPPEKSKRGRKRSSFTMAKSMSAMPVDSQLSQYTYTFHVPTPIYKRLKLLQKSMIPEENAVCIVRMHPMDARRYSLLKIGRELVKIPKLEERDIKRIQKEIKETGYYPGACSRFGYMVPSDQPSISTKIGLLPGLLNEPKPVSSYEPGIKYVTVDRKLLPMSAKGMGKNAPSGFQLEYERMLSQNPRNRARSNVKIKLTKAKEKRRRRKVRVTNRRKGSCDLLSDSSLYTDCSLVSQLPYNKNLPSTTPHNQYLLPSSASEITSHSKTPVLIETLHSPPIANIQSSNATENTLPPVKTTHVRRSTRPFPKHNVVPPLPGARPRIITDNKYRSSNNNNFNTQNSQLPTSHATNITPPVKLCPGQCPEQPTNLTMSLPQQTADTTFDAHPKIDNITELEVRPSSSNNSSPSPLSSCKDNQSPFPTNIGSPHDPPPTSGSSLWQPSNTPTGQSFTVNSSIQSSSNSQDSQQVRKRKLGSDNGSQDGSKRTMNFSTMDFTDIYDPHSEGYDDDDVDADDDDDGDDDDDDDDSHDNFDHKASSGNVCCLVVNKRAHQRSLVVKLEKLKLPSKTVKASEFLATRDGIPHRSCVGNKIPGRVENIGWERIKLADKNKYRGGVPLMSYSSPISDDNGRLSLFTQHSGSMFYDRPASDYFQDEYLGVAIAGSLDESNDTGLLMSIDDDGYSQMINTDSSSGEDATISYEEEFEIKSRGKNKRKRNLTPNQRLGVAFLTTRHRRKRAVAMNHGKLMNSLSLLHQATLAKLSTLSTYTDSSDDFKKTYNDVMSKLALFSPPVSEKGDTSPPQPLSPEENAPLPVVDGNPDDVSLDSTDGVLSQPNFLSQTSLDSIYETPLSSVETQRSCESAKSPSLTSLGGSETEPTSDIIVPVVKQDEAAENKSPPIPTLLSWKNETPTEKSPYAVKTAVVKLIPRARSGSKSKVDCKPENNNNDLEVAVPLNSTIRNFSIINSNQQKESSEIEGFPNVQFRIECKQKASVDQLETSQAHSKLVVSNQSSNCTEDEISRAEEQTNTSPGPYQTGIYSLNCPEETSSDRLNSYSNCDAADTDVGYLMDKIDNEETQNTLIEERETVSEVCHKDTTEKSEVELKNIANKLPASPGIELGGNLEETEKSTEHQVLQTTQLICELNKETEETTAKQTGVTCDSEMVESAQRKETVKKISETADQENGVSKAASESIKNTTESHLHIGSQNTICEEGPLNDVSSQKEVNGGQCITTSKQGEISRSGEEVEQSKKALAAEDDVFNSDITTLDLSVSPKTGVLQSSKSSGNSSKEKESADTSEPNQTNQAAPKKSQKVNVGSNESIGSERQDDHFKNASPQPVAGKESLVLTPRDRPPSKDLICHTATKYGLSIPKVTEPFCGKPEDITETPREHGGRILRLQCNLIKDLTPFASTLDSDTLDTWRFVLAANNKTIPVDTNLKSLNEIVNDPQVSCHLPGSGQRVWVPCLPPPSYQRVKSSLAPPSPSPTPPPLSSSLSSQQPQSSSSSQPAPPPSSLSSPSSSSSQPPPSPSSSPSSSYSSSSSQNNKRATQQLKVNLKIDPKNIGSTGESDKECFKKLTGHSPKHLSTSPLTISPIFSNLNNKKKNETSFDDSLFGSENFMCDKPAQEIDPGVTSSAQHQDLLKQDILSDSEILDLEETLVEPKSPVWADRSDRSVKNLSQDTNLAQSNSQDDRSKSVSERENMQTLNVALPENLPSTRIVPQFHSTPVHRISVSSPLASPTPVSKPQLTESANKSNDTLPSKATKGHTLSSSHKLKRKAISNQMKQWSLNSTLTSQIDIATPKNSCGFKVSQIQCKDTKSSHKVQHICLMSLELLMRTRGDRCPDPQTDDIQAAFCVFLQDSKPGDMVTVVIVVDDDHLSLRAPKGSNRSRTLHATALPEGVDIIHVTDETELMHKIESLVQSWDPDMLIGYEVTTLSWGYLLQRAAYLNIELASKISRIPSNYSFKCLNVWDDIL